MDNRKRNRYEMAQVNYQFLTDSSSTTIIGTDANVGPLVIDLGNNLLNIAIELAIQDLNPHGAVLDKDNILKKTITDAEPILVGLKSYYTSLNDMTDFTEINFPVSIFKQTNIVETINKFQLLHDKAAAVTPASLLIPFFITAPMITGLATDLTKLSAAVPVWRSMKGDSVGATKAMDALFVEQKGIYKKLDLFIKIYKFTQPAFYQKYLNSRKIYNYGKQTVSVAISLEVGQSICVMKDKYQEGDFLTFRNKSKKADVVIYQVNDESEVPTKNGITLTSVTNVQAQMGKDLGGDIKRMIYIKNISPAFKATMTIILSHGKSSSKAPPISNITPLPPPSPA